MTVSQRRTRTDKRGLSRQDLTVSTLGYRSMGTAIGYGPADDTESIAVRRTSPA
jgi:hypothetical protein